jgi:hypothetical protein
MIDLLPFLIPFVRGLLILLSVYSLGWTWTGPRDLIRGVVWPVPIYRTAIFCFAMVMLGFSGTYFLEIERVGEGAWSLLWLMFGVVGLSAACAGRFSGHFHLGERFYSLILGGHLKAALAMADYHAAFPQDAEALACRLNDCVAKHESGTHE